MAEEIVTPELSSKYTFTEGRRDILSVVGIVSGLSLLLFAIYSGGGLGQFLDLNSFLITFGGVVAATFISFPAYQVFKVLGMFLKIFGRRIRSVEEIIAAIVTLSVTSKRGGFLALEKEEGLIGDEYLKEALTMVVDGLPEDVIRETLQADIDSTIQRHLAGQQIFISMANFSPAFGMIGTVIGLVQMLSNMADPKSIGPAMAVALITTFYGAIMANFIFIPSSEKLKARMNDEILLRTVIMEGILGLRKNMDTRVLETKLNGYLPLKKKVRMKFS